MISLHAKIENWPVAGEFRISRSTITHVTVVKVEARSGVLKGYGECRPYARYNETPELVCAQIDSLRDKWESLTTETLQDFLPAGAARNAVDCALWDLKAQRLNKSFSELLHLRPAGAVTTAYTLSIDTAVKMQMAASRANEYSLLKIKISNLKQGLDAAKAILNARPDAELIIDANEALTVEDTQRLRDALNGAPILTIEQPVSAKEKSYKFEADTLPIVCADEALHTGDDLEYLWRQGYRAVNIKLDKAGGLTESMRVVNKAKSMGFVIMLGCMVGTSLAIAPAMLLSPYADIIDLDGAALLSKDRMYNVQYMNGQIMPTPRKLWGYPRGDTRMV